MKKKIYFIIGGIIACGALAYLLFAFFNNRAAYDIKVSDFVDKENSYIGKQMRVDGFVVQDTIDWTSSDFKLKFILDNGTGANDGGKRLMVYYSGGKQDPNKFIDGIQILVAGKYNKNGVFIANSITYECPNEYKTN
jgi:cytochrome c-type biogenesis protein CcmE